LIKKKDILLNGFVDLKITIHLNVSFYIEG